MKEGDIGIRQDGSHLSSEPIWWMWAVDHQVVRSLSEKYPQDQQAAAFCSGCSGVKPQPDLCTARTRITLRDEKFLCSWVTSLISWELGGSGYVFFLNGGSEVVLIKDVICIIMPVPLCVKLGTCEGKSSCILPSFALPIPKWSASDGKLCKSKQWCLSSFEGLNQQWELTTAACKGHNYVSEVTQQHGEFSASHSSQQIYLSCGPIVSVMIVMCLLRLQVFAAEGPKSFILLQVEAEIFRPRILSTVQKDTCLLSHPQRAVFIFHMKCFQNLASCMD